MFGKEAEKRKRYFLNLIAQTLLLIREVVNRFWARKLSFCVSWLRRVRCYFGRLRSASGTEIMISQTATNRFSEQQILKGQNCFSEKAVCAVKHLPGVFKKKEFGFCATTVCFWGQKESVIWQYQRACSDKATPNKWLQSEPATIASFFGSGRVPAEPRVMPVLPQLG